MTRWRPMSEAPKDGTDILCLGERGRIFVCTYTESGWWAPGFLYMVSFRAWTPLPEVPATLPWENVPAPVSNCDLPVADTGPDFFDVWG